MLLAEVVAVGEQNSYSESLPIENEKVEDIFGGRGLDIDFVGGFVKKQREMENKLSPEKSDRVKQILANHAIGSVSPEHCNPHLERYVGEFTARDWNFILRSKIPEIALNTIVRYYQIMEKTSGFTEGIWDIPRHYPDAQGVAELSTLPLVYQTSLEKLEAIMETGEVYSDRRLSQESNDEIKTNTALEDRTAGLDNYVFTFFGKPYTGLKYGDIQILFKPDRLYTDEESFVTDDDYVQLMGRTMAAKPDLGYKEIDAEVRKEYCDQVMLGRGEYFLRSAYAKLSQSHYRGSFGESQNGRFLSGETDQKNNYGEVFFSTWEVKVPEFEVGEIDRIVFSKKSDLLAFASKYPNSQIDCVYSPNDEELLEMYYQERFKDTVVPKGFKMSHQELISWLETLLHNEPAKKKELFGDLRLCLKLGDMYTLSDASVRYKETLVKQIEADYQERSKAINLASPEEKIELYVRVDCPKNLITHKANIYELRAGDVYFSVDELEKEFATKVQSRRKSLFKPPDPLEYTFVKVQALKSEYDKNVKPIIDHRLVWGKKEHVKFSGKLDNHIIVDILSLIED